MPVEVRRARLPVAREVEVRQVSPRLKRPLPNEHGPDTTVQSPYLICAVLIMAHGNLSECGADEYEVEDNHLPEKVEHEAKRDSAKPNLYVISQLVA